MIEKIIATLEPNVIAKTYKTMNSFKNINYTEILKHNERVINYFPPCSPIGNIEKIAGSKLDIISK